MNSMRLRATVAGLSVAFLVVLASIASAGPCEETIGLLSPRHYAPTPLVDAAAVIVVFTPHVSITTIAPVERVVPGDIHRVEKGVAPQSIVYTANTFGAFPEAGVRT